MFGIVSVLLVRVNRCGFANLSIFVRVACLLKTGTSLIIDVRKAWRRNPASFRTGATILYSTIATPCMRIVAGIVQLPVHSNSTGQIMRLIPLARSSSGVKAKHLCIATALLTTEYQLGSFGCIVDFTTVLSSQKEFIIGSVSACLPLRTPRVLSVYKVDIFVNKRLVGRCILLRSGLFCSFVLLLTDKLVPLLSLCPFEIFQRIRLPCTYGLCQSCFTVSQEPFKFR